MIESISLGKLLFMGKVSRSDTIVYNEHMDTKWWIKGRNMIDVCDIQDVLSEKPDIVVVGLGFIMPIKISDQSVEKMRGKGIEVFVGKSDEAAKVFNDNIAKRKIIGLFHLL